jgi:hypothetical protein
MNDTDILAGIVAAGEEDAMPRVVATFEHPAGTVDIIEPVMGSDDGVRRGYLWTAILGDYILTPTRRGDYDPDRWVPGNFELLDGARIVATSVKSVEQAIKNARRVLRNQE